MRLLISSLLLGLLFAGGLRGQSDAEIYYEAGTSFIGLQGLGFGGVLGDPNSGNNQVQLGCDLRVGYFVNDNAVIGALIGYDYTRILSQQQVLRVHAISPALFGRYYFNLETWALFGEVGIGAQRFLTQGISPTGRFTFAYGLIGFTYRPARWGSVDLGIGPEARRNVLGLVTYQIRPNIGVNLHF
jgi:hypothetical protein